MHKIGTYVSMNSIPPVLLISVGYLVLSGIMIYIFLTALANAETKQSHFPRQAIILIVDFYVAFVLYSLRFCLIYVGLDNKLKVLIHESNSQSSTSLVWLKATSLD